MNTKNRCSLTTSTNLLCVLLLFTALALSACVPSEYPPLPGIPEELRAIPDALAGMDLPELSGIALPGLDALGVLTAPPGGIVFAGPTAPQVAAGARLPGTDITYVGKGGTLGEVSAENEDAIFTIAGLRSARRVGDSVDFDGAWPGIPGSIYQVRLRIYAFNDNGVWLAGVQQLLLPNIAPERGRAPDGVVTLRFPFVDGVEADGSDTIHGTTFGYMGKYARGAQLSGPNESEYPYRAVGDSIAWQGTLRPEVGAKYDLRALAYGRESLRVGGTVALVMATE